MFKIHRWLAATFAMMAVGLMLVSGVPIVMHGTIAVGAPAAPTSTPPASPPIAEVGTITGDNALSPAVQAPSCSESFGANVVILAYDLGQCSAAQEVQTILGSTAQAIANDIVISFENDMNQTAVQASLYNATIQELMSYFAQRAEAIVPSYLNQSWTPVLQDTIATQSGLVPAMEGILTALGEQEYQDWNATVNSYDNYWGTGMAYATGGSVFNLETAVFPVTAPNGVLGITMVLANFPRSTAWVSQPWEFWSGSPLAENGQSTIYFNIAPGGTLFDANINNDSNPYWAGNWTVTDLTTGGGPYTVPDVSYVQWENQSASLPTFTHTNPIGQFDLLKAVCSSGCVPTTLYGGGDASGGSSFLETSGAYAFTMGPAAPLPDINPYNVMVPHVIVGQAEVPHGHSAFLNTGVFFPSTHVGICITYTDNLQGQCQANQTSATGPPWTAFSGTQVEPTEGFATQVSGGPGQVVGGNDTLTQLAGTFQSVLNNTMTLAHTYWAVLRAATDKGVYSIPANCAIPFPSAAFPAATNPANYQLSLANTEVVYLGYLESVARFLGAGSPVSNTVGFCGDPDLGLTYNWSSTWNLHTNITASVYFGDSVGATYANGTADPSAVFSVPSTWPVKNVDPTLLYPFEYQMNVPVGHVYALPVNNPIAAVLLNYTGNEFYGAGLFTPNWGVPTYLSLQGNGNITDVSGYVSTTTSGYPLNESDAIYISSCYVGAVLQSTCSLAVNYFNNFTYGIIHAFVALSCSRVGNCVPPAGSGGGGLSNLGNGCGFGNLDQWYDGWAGYLGSAVASAFTYIGNIGKGIPIIGGGWSDAWNGLGCIIAWIVVIVVIILLFLLVFWIARSVYRIWK